MLTMNVFFVDSPLQLSSANSVAIDNKILICCTGSRERKKNNTQIFQLIDEGNWEKTYLIRRDKFLLDKIYQIYLILKIISLVFRFKGKVDGFYFGEFRSIWSHIFRFSLKAKQDILLDDGAVTLDIQMKMLESGVGYQHPNSFLEKIRVIIFEKVFSSKLDNLTPPHLYTFFELTSYLLPGQRNFYSKVSKFSLTNQEEAIYFFGSKYSESGLLDLSDELNYLANVKEYFFANLDTCEYKLYYIPHRDDSAKKLGSLTDIGFAVLDLKMPAEEYFKKSRKGPKIISGFWTTVLYSAHRNINNVSVIAFDNSGEIAVINEKERAMKIYEYYKSVGIKVVEEF